MPLTAGKQNTSVILSPAITRLTRFTQMQTTIWNSNYFYSEISNNTNNISIGTMFEVLEVIGEYNDISIRRVIVEILNRI